MTIDNRTVYDVNGLSVEVELENGYADMSPQSTSISVTVRMVGHTVALANVEGSTIATSLLDVWETRPLWATVKSALEWASRGVKPGAAADAVALALTWSAGKLA